MELDFQSFIEKVKEKNQLEDIVEATGGEFKLQRKRGNYLRGQHHQSLVIRVDEQYYVWNGNGGERGDVFNWVMNRRNWDFIQALEYLADKAGMEMPKAAKDDAPARIAARQREDVLGLAARLMAEMLWKDEEALGYARGRGWSDETIREAGVGFSGRDPAATAKNLGGEFAMHGIDPGSPAAVAVLGFRGDVKGWGATHEVEVNSNWVEWGMIPGLIGRKRLVYAHYEGGRCKYLSGRNILGDETNRDGAMVKSFNLAKALVGERRPFFNHLYGRRAESCMVIEGPADAITLAEWDIPAVALLGTNWEDHHELLKALRERHQAMYIGLDADEAGEAALLGRERDWPLGRYLGPLARVVRWRAARVIHPRENLTEEARKAVEQGSRDAEERKSPEELREEIKDANDLLKLWVSQGVHGEAQKKEIEELLAATETMAEEMCRWAGGLKGIERDMGFEATFRVIGMMKGTQISMYRPKLVGLLGIGIRDFNHILKATTNVDHEGSAATIVETLGGYYGGWLLEYLYDPKENLARLAYRDPEGKVGVTDGVDIEGVRYVPARVTEFVRTGGVYLPSDLGPLKPTRELVAYVEAFINEHYLLDNRSWGRIMGYYVLLTWVYDMFPALCYLRAMGDAGAGKSELMWRVGHLCYRLLPTSGASSASSFFRMTQTYRGTVFLDESDLRDGGDMTNDLVKFLNLGAMKGGAVIKMKEVVTENGREYEIERYDAFCPKLIAMRKDFKDDAVGSRSLTFKLAAKFPHELKAAGVRLQITRDFRERALALRNLLVRWRMQMWQPEMELGEELMDLEISSRLNQVTMPLKALAADDPALQGEIEHFLREYHKEMILTRSMTIAARIVEALWKIYKYPDLRETMVIGRPDGQEMIYIRDVRKIANELMDMENEGEEKDDDEEGKKRRKRGELTARGVGAVIRNELQLKVSDRTMIGYPVIWDQIKMEALALRFGVNYKAIGATNGTYQEEMPPAPEEKKALEQGRLVE